MKDICNNTWVMVLGFVAMAVLVILIIKTIFKLILGLAQTYGYIVPLILFIFILIARESAKAEDAKGK